MLFRFDVLTFAGATGAAAACRLRTNAKVRAGKERAWIVCMLFLIVSTDREPGTFGRQTMKKWAFCLPERIPGSRINLFLSE